MSVHEIICNCVEDIWDDFDDDVIFRAECVGRAGVVTVSAGVGVAHFDTILGEGGSKRPGHEKIVDGRVVVEIEDAGPVLNRVLRGPQFDCRGRVSPVPIASKASTPSNAHHGPPPALKSKRHDNSPV